MPAYPNDRLCETQFPVHRFTTFPSTLKAFSYATLHLAQRSSEALCILNARSKRRLRQAVPLYGPQTAKRHPSHYCFDCSQSPFCKEPKDTGGIFDNFGEIRFPGWIPFGGLFLPLILTLSWNPSKSGSNDKVYERANRPNPTTGKYITFSVHF